MKLMVTIEKRRHPRFDSVNLSHICVDDGDSAVIGQGMGRTLNVSESGILLETHFSIEAGLILSLTIAFEEDLVDIRGKVAHSKKGQKEKTFESGIEFMDMDEPSFRTLKKFIQLFEESSAGSDTAGSAGSDTAGSAGSDTAESPGSDTAGSAGSDTAGISSRFISDSFSETEDEQLLTGPTA